MPNLEPIKHSKDSTTHFQCNNRPKPDGCCGCSGHDCSSQSLKTDMTSYRKLHSDFKKLLAKDKAKPCRDFEIACSNCQGFLALNIIADWAQAEKLWKVRPAKKRKSVK